MRGPPEATPGAPPHPLELWGGIECTINRVGDASFDQLGRSGHLDRLDDLDRFAALGLRTLRYPILWEQLAPDGLDRIDWGWADERLGRLRALGIRPIVGLCHHGSGPRHTHLLDPGFAGGLAAFARAVAERYPWVEDYTPVNEPLTTARFAALYGHWYPHARSDRAFARAVVNQCRAVSLAMREIRRVNPAARLVQTEDLAKTFSTPELAYQADHENERRWLSLDLLCGLAGRAHPLWAHLWWLGLEGDDLFPFLEEPCPPDVVGLNYYVTGERFLDHRLDRYPEHVRGGNGRDAYADVEAVRVLAGGIAGPGGLLREAWARFGRPLAVTEAHLGSTREEQARWLVAVWNEAEAARRDGVDLRAVTVWSLLGSFDWHCLLARCENRYEPGAFDVRAPLPRPTAVARVAADLAHGRTPDHPALATPGWWRRPGRLLYPPVDRAGADAHLSDDGHVSASPPIAIGGDGALARGFARSCEGRALPWIRLDGYRLPVGSAREITTALDAIAPWAVIDASEPPAPAAIARRAGPNVRAATLLAEAAARRGIALLAVSSALVVGQEGHEPPRESAPVAPRTPLGAWHARREAATLGAHPGALVVRTGPLFGTGEHLDPVAAVLDALERGKAVEADDRRLSPVYLPDLVEACLDLLIDGETGVWHLSQETVGWAELLRRAAHLAQLDPRRVVSSHRPSAEPSEALVSERGWPLPPLNDALARFAWHWRHARDEPARSAAD